MSGGTVIVRTLLLGVLVGCAGGDTYTPPTTQPNNDRDGDGFSLADGDCDDEDDATYPGALDVVGDGIDQSCDLIDGVDADHDTHASNNTGGDDCDDADPDRYPDAVEIGWDGIDQNCDQIDLEDYIELAAGQFHTCALDSLGRIKCFGSDERTQSSGHPIDAGWKHISSGPEYACAVHTDGRLVCWGSDDEYQIRQVPEGTDWDQVSCGHTFACALTRAGNATCWGGNDIPATPEDIDHVIAGTPTEVQFQSIASGDEFACGVTQQDGIVTCWGNNKYDQRDDVPFQHHNLSVVAGASHACARRQDLGLQCWGDNAFGQTSAPSDAGPYSMLATSDNVTCGIIEAEQLSCWGLNNQFQVSDAPTNVDAHYVTIGHDHGCIVRNSDSRIQCWGKNDLGQATPPE
ncbi:MAG: MopE-related protein [Myxococcota bacterium]